MSRAMVLNRLYRGEVKEVFEPNVFINGIGDQITTIEDIFNDTYLLGGDPALASNLQNNGKDISFHYNGKFFGFGDVATGVTDVFLLEDVLTGFVNTSFGNSRSTIKNILIPKSNFATSFQSLRSLGVRKFYAPLINTLGESVNNDQIFRETNAVDFICESVLSTINSGSPDGDITDLINNWNGTVTYSTDKTKPTAATMSATTNIGGTFVELNVSQPAHVNTLKYALVFVDGFFQDIYDINNVFVTNLQEQTNYDIKVIIADEYFNISPYSNTINVTTTTTPALFQNAVAYYNLDETGGNAIDLVNGYNGTLFGGVTQGVAGKIGTAYSFDGVNGGNITTGIIPESLNDGVNNKDFSFSCWISATQINLYTSLFYSSDSTGEIAFQFLNNGITRIRIQVTGSTFLTEWNFTPTLNQLQFITITFSDVNGFRFYVDGVEQIRTLNPSSFPLIPFSEIYLGKYKPLPNDGRLYYGGILDEFNFIINQEYTIGEISDLYNNGNGTTI